MGDEISKDQFNETDYQMFQQKLDAESAFVRELFNDRRFDNQTRKLGYELELCLLDAQGRPAPYNRQVLEKADNPLFTYELAKFNLEINGNAFDFSTNVFDQISDDLEALYAQVRSAAMAFELQTGLFGVLPSLEQEHLDSENYMSDLFRYRLLDRRLIEMRERPVKLDIHGDDHLSLEQNNVMLEALSTSLQTHLQMPFDESVDCYHAALWTSMAALAVGANSPLVLGKKCWQESRIAIFKQSVDTRNPREVDDSVIPRVHFGKGYINSWQDLFDDNNYYSPILPENQNCAVDELHHFNLHNGTIWRWVRPILGCVNGIYHLRLELRVTPSGPTLIDTMANMVFSVGLLEGLRQAGAELTKIPFESLESDFYKVAREGLDASITWYDGRQNTMQNLLLESIIPCARHGLQNLNVEATDKWLNIIEARVASGRTGADWILKFCRDNDDMSALVRRYLDHAQSNTPVHLWSN